MQDYKIPRVEIMIVLQIKLSSMIPKEPSQQSTIINTGRDLQRKRKSVHVFISD